MDKIDFKKVGSLTVLELKQVIKDCLNKDDLITYKEACSMFKISQNQLNYRISKGTLGSFKCKNNIRYVNKTDLQRLIDNKILIPNK